MLRLGVSNILKMMIADAPCPREYSLRPAVHLLLFQPGVFRRAECPFRRRPGCELQLVEAYFFYKMDET